MYVVYVYIYIYIYIYIIHASVPSRAKSLPRSPDPEVRLFPTVMIINISGEQKRGDEKRGDRTSKQKYTTNKHKQT